MLRHTRRDIKDMQLIT